MTRNERREMIRNAFSEVLLPEGFALEKKCYSDTFWRKTSDDIYHIISPRMLSRTEKYDVYVFATSPALARDFAVDFPCDLILTNAPMCYLSPEEKVGRYQKLYFCKNPDAFANSFRRDVKPALINYAIPYLDAIQTMEDLFPTIGHDSIRGAALLDLGRYAEAKSCIEREIVRLEALPKDEFGHIQSEIAFQLELLAKVENAL